MKNKKIKVIVHNKPSPEEAKRKIEELCLLLSSMNFS